MTASSQIGDFFVEFSERGAAALSAVMGNIEAQLKKLQAGADAVGKVSAKAFGIATAAVGGWVVAGVAASAMGQALNMQLNILSRTIAGLFREEISGLIRGIANLRAEIQRLFPEQKQQIADWTKAALAGLAVAAVLPRVIAGLQVMATTIQAVVTAGAVGFLPLLGGLITAFAGLGAGSIVLREGFTGLFDRLKPLAAGLLQLAENVIILLQPLMTLGELIFNVLVRALEAINAVLSSSIGRWLALTVAFAGILSLVPKIVAGITAIIAAVRTLITAKIILMALSGPKGWLMIAAGLAAAGIAAAVVNSQLEGVTNKGKPKKDQSTLPPSLGGFESFEQAYMRIQTAALIATVGVRPVDEQQLEELRAANTQLGQINAAVRNRRDQIVS